MPEIRRLRDTDLGRVLCRPFPTARGLPELEGCDVEGALPVLRGPRDHDATGSPRVSGRREAGRTRLVDPVRPEQIPGARAGRRSPRASGLSPRDRSRAQGELSEFEAPASPTFPAELHPSPVTAQ